MSRFKRSRFFFSSFLVRFETRQYLRERFGFFRIKQLLSLFRKKKKYSPSDVISKLELRLGSALVSLGFAPTQLASRQLITHGFVTVNGKPIQSSNYQLSLGDIISIPSTKGRLIVSKYLKNKLSVLLSIKLPKSSASKINFIRKKRLSKAKANQYLLQKKVILKSSYPYYSKSFLRKRIYHDAKSYNIRIKRMFKPFFFGFQHLDIINDKVKAHWIGNRLHLKKKNSYNLFYRAGTKINERKSHLYLNDWNGNNFLKGVLNKPSDSISVYRKLFISYMFKEQFHKKSSRFELFSWKERMLNEGKFKVHFYRSKDVQQTFLFLASLGHRISKNSIYKDVNYFINVKKYLFYKNSKVKQKEHRDFMLAMLPQVASASSYKKITIKNKRADISQFNKKIIRIFIGRVARNFVYKIPKLGEGTIAIEPHRLLKSNNILNQTKKQSKKVQKIREFSTNRLSRSSDKKVNTRFKKSMNIKKKVNIRRFVKNTFVDFKLKRRVNLKLPPSHFEIDMLKLSATLIKQPRVNRWFLNLPSKIPLAGLHVIIKTKC